MDKPLERVIASQFRLERELASGGMGTVYLAEQLGVSRTVVVKLMRPSLTADMPAAIERFQLEARLGAQLNHPHVVQIYVFGRTEGGEFYLAMEYVDGHSLAEVLQRAGPLPEGRVLRIAYQTCDALSHAHHAGLVHRDLKPANLMVCERHGDRDYLKVLDFGIAKPAGGHSKLTSTGVIVGTPDYMAPEQARGLPVDARTDIYALGCVLYELLGGQTPFAAESATDVLVGHLIKTPEPLSRRFPGLVLQPRVEAIVQKCLQKDPASRYQSASELQDDIRRALHERPSATRRASTPMVADAEAPRTSARPSDGLEGVDGVEFAPQSDVQVQPFPRWKLLTLSWGLALCAGTAGLIYGVYGVGERALGSVMLSPNVHLRSGVRIGGVRIGGSGPNLRTQKVWGAFRALRDVEHHCVDRYFADVPAEGPQPGKRYYVGMNCPSSELATAKTKSEEANAQPLLDVLPVLEKACELCAAAHVYYETEEYRVDDGAKGRVLHASLVSLASSYLPRTDAMADWVYGTMTEFYREALDKTEPGSVSHAFRALVVAAHAAIAAKEASQLSRLRQALENAIHNAERASEALPQTAGAVNGYVGLARELSIATMRVERLAPAGGRLPRANEGASDDWRRLVEANPDDLGEAREQQGTWFEAVLDNATKLEEIESYGLLR